MVVTRRLLLVELADMVDYTFAMMPIILPQLAVPPLQYLHSPGHSALHGQPEWLADMFIRIYTIVPRDLLDCMFVRSLCARFDSSGRLISKWYTLGTCMFVHADYDHLLINISSLWAVGRPAYDKFGATWTYALFILGGVYAVLPKLEHLPKIGDSSFATADTGDSNLLAKGADWFRSKGADWWREIGAARSPLCCGSSGGVSALLGCSCVLAGWKVYKLLNKRKNRYINRQGNLGRPDDHQDDVTVLKVVLSNFSIIAYGLNWFQMECVKLSVQERNAGTGSIFDSFSKKIIGHSAHIRGFAFGAAFTVLSISFAG